ncbi:MULTISPECIES: class I SAM-dependent methyltransferase [Acidithrix]|uniref:Putative S-adenosyl-L-methionine-dependent methyltransferase TehB n=1 Tax=Acidithrix ferrooxidans TaxID=1280514 RepID=A0A0D8HK99_9ACTN|nr:MULTISPECIES: class I SAM-dependent methyltransferase [Acidithrix]KJF18375.1 putative S-adenosyl-L-methionine-dependent methyltransferase TehB [Acidithrix ferrooxidans]
MSNAQMWNERYAGIDRLWIPEPDPKLADVISNFSPGKALDLGCGEGRNAMYLAKTNWEVTAVDFSSVALERLARAANEAGVKVDTICSDIFDFLDQDDSYDLIVIANIHPSRTLRLELYKKAIKRISLGGHLFLIGHHIESLGIVGPSDPDLLMDDSEVTEAFVDQKIVRLEKITDIADHGHSAPSLLAVIEKL